MKKTELEMVGWFKAELRSYYHDAPRIKYLESKLKQLNNRFEAHSPNLSSDKHREFVRRLMIVKWGRNGK